MIPSYHKKRLLVIKNYEKRTKKRVLRNLENRKKEVCKNLAEAEKLSESMKKGRPNLVELTNLQVSIIRQNELLATILLTATQLKDGELSVKRCPYKPPTHKEKV